MFGSLSPAVPIVPVTSTFALPLSLYYVLLQIRVSLARIKTKTSLAHSSSDAPKSTASDSDPLLVAFRSQANFAENVPLALLLAALVEANGGNRVALSAVLTTLTVGRIMHAEFGLMAPGSGGIGRPIGFFSSLVVTAGLGIYGAWLSRSHWYR